MILLSQIRICVEASPEDVALLSPPSNAFKLTAPKVNEIVYTVTLNNPNNSATDVRLDIALPKTWIPDTGIQITKIASTHGKLVSYVDGGNNYGYLTANLGPKESLQINITFYSLKYKVDFSTYKPTQNFSYPNEYIKYTQPERFIESNDPLLVNKAKALAGDLKDPIQIGEKIYDFVRSYLTYEPQPEIRGASWALLNGQGDCSEHGTLFVALLRALGIPSRTVTGHASREIARGGVANATGLWINSPHMWAEFYVEGAGWVPVDPTFGKDDPLDHFGITWAYYLPIMKGPSMESPYRALYTYKPASIKSSAYLIIKPLNDLSSLNETIVDFYEANNYTNVMIQTAFSAYKNGFNITEAYTSIQKTYDFLQKTISELEKKTSIAKAYAKKTRLSALNTSRLISEIMLREATKTVYSHWKNLKLLGILSGHLYLERARASASKGDFNGVVNNVRYAVSAVEKAPNIFVFIGPVALSLFTIWVIAKNDNKN